jgi:predicted metal-dependent phosphotriesterase family hydrolase
MLRDAGLDDGTLRMILEDNPRRFLTFEPRG